MTVARGRLQGPNPVLSAVGHQPNADPTPLRELIHQQRNEHRIVLDRLVADNRSRAISYLIRIRSKHRKFSPLNARASRMVL